MSHCGRLFGNRRACRRAKLAFPGEAKAIEVIAPCLATILPVAGTQVPAVRQPIGWRQSGRILR